MIGDLNADQIDRLLRTEYIARIGCHDGERSYVVPISSASNNHHGPNLQRPDPNVSEPHRVAVVLEVERPFVGDTLERRGSSRLSIHRDMVLDQNAVVEHRE